MAVCACTWCPLILLLAVASAALDCCPGGGRLQVPPHNCSDGVRLDLDCPFYLLRADQDAFHVGPDGSLLVGTELVPADRFCESRLLSGDVRALLVCAPEEPAEGWRVDPLLRVFGACLALSAALLLSTAALYCALPPLRDVEGGCLVGYMASLGLGSLGLACVQLAAGGPHPHCVEVAFFVYFCLLSAFFWLNVVAVDTWRRVCVPRRRLPLSEGQLFAAYCCYAVAAPGAFLAAALVTHHGAAGEGALRPNFGHTSCWFSGQRETWAYFYGPVACLLAVNVVVFLWAAAVLWRLADSRAARRLRFRTKLCTKLFLLMGVSWVFEVLSYAVGGPSYLWIVTDLLNALQGVLVFLLLVVFRKRVLRLLAERVPLLRRCVGGDKDDGEAAGSSGEDEGEELASTA